MRVDWPSTLLVLSAVLGGLNVDVVDAFALNLDAAIAKFLVFYAPILFGTCILNSQKRSWREAAVEIPVLFFVILSLAHISIWALGPPYKRTWKEDGLFTVLLASLVAIPLSFAKGSGSTFDKAIFQRMSPESDSFFLLPSACTVVGAWCGALVIPLDWGRPWQVWPVSCCIGAISGHFGGFLLQSLVSLLFT